MMATGIIAGGALALSATAAADPPPPPIDPAVPLPLPIDPAVPLPPPAQAPPPPPLRQPLAQNGQPGGGPAGMPNMGALVPDLLLSQNATPAAPGDAPAAPPPLDAMNNNYLLPQNAAPAAPGQGEVSGLAPGAENSDASGIEYLKRLHEAYQQGGLRGIMLGQMPNGHQGEPLPAAGLPQSVTGLPPDPLPPPPAPILPTPIPPVPLPPA